MDGILSVPSPHSHPFTAPPPHLSPHSAPGLDNLLYSADADFSCFADLAITSPGDYYKEGEGSLMQCVLTPGDKWMPTSTEAIAEATLAQVKKLFPSAEGLEVSSCCLLY